MKIQFYYNEFLKNYTLKKEIENTKSIKKIPLRFKFNDETKRFRKEILKNEILEN